MKNCFIHNTGRVFIESGGGTGAISAHGDNILIDSNIFTTNGRLTHSPPHGSDYNLDHDIYVDGANLVIQNNLFYGDHPSGWNVQLPGFDLPGYPGKYNSHNVKIINNTFAGGYNPAKQGNIILWGQQDNTIVNNNIFAAASVGVGINCYSSGGGAAAANNNLIASGMALYNTSGTYGGCNAAGNIALAVTGTATGNPLFTNPNANDFTLQSGSPAINAGLATNAPAYDYAGITRPQGSAYDIGAYEFQSFSDTTPPAPPSNVSVQ